MPGRGRLSEPVPVAVRPRDVSARRTLPLLALGALLCGCGQATLTTTPAAGHPSPTPSAAPESAAGNRHAAQREAHRLLSLANVPPDAVATRLRPQGLDGPAMGMSAASSLIDETRYWRVATGLDATITWLRAHPPRGLTSAGTTAGSAPSYRMAGLGYTEPNRPGMQDLELAIGAVTLPGGGAVIRADGMAIWLEPRPLADTRTGSRMRVTVTGGCPGNDAGAEDVTAPLGDDQRDLDKRLLPAAAPLSALICDYSGMNGHHRFALLRGPRLDAAAARRLARSIAQLPLGHPVDEAMHCPMSDGSATVLAFSYDGRPDVDLWLDRNGCAYLSNGAILTRAGDIADDVTVAEHAAQ